MLGQSIEQTDRIRDEALDWHEKLQNSPVPRLYHDNLAAYFTRRVNPGSFLRVVLENKFWQSVRKVDPLYKDRLVPIMEWLLVNAPPNSWGSEEAVEEWLTPAHHLTERT